MLIRPLSMALSLALCLGALLSGGPPASAQTKVKTVATFSILSDLVAEVAGDLAEISTLVGADVDAHTYQPRPADARALANARVLVSNGLGFEGWIDRLAKAAPFKGRAIVATVGVPTLEAAPTPGHRAASHGFTGATTSG